MSTTRTRTRKYKEGLNKSYQVMLTREYDVPDATHVNGIVSNNTVYASGTFTSRDESITDLTVAQPEVTVDPRTQKWVRIRHRKVTDPYILGLGPYRAFRPVNPCSHTTKRIDTQFAFQPLTCQGSRRSSGPSATNVYTWNFVNQIYGAQYLTGNSSADIADFLSGSTPAYSAGAYKGVDWFALSSSFREACESYVKSKFLAGEDLYENEIFVDAFKILLNPTSAISVLVKHLKHGLGAHATKRFSRMTLGQFARSVKGAGKHATQWHLSYDFAVRPAIDDVKAILDAHDFVSKRMFHLRQYSGAYVPVRVRQDLMSDFSNTPPSALAVGVRSRLFHTCEYKRTTAVISAWGRVRQDLDWNDTWSAYLQYFGIGKIIGLAWELIPGSFLLDWITDAQEKINDLTRLRSGSPFCGIRNVSASLKQELRENFFLNPGFEPVSATQLKQPSNPIHVCTRDTSTYSRYREIPQTSGLVDISNLGLFHYTKLGELIFQLWV
jgi:hypothetical protein